MPTLDWLNRDAAFRIAAEVPYRMLELVSEHRSEQPNQLSSESPNKSGQGSDKGVFSKNNKNSDQAQLNWSNDEIANKENQSPATPAPAAASAPAPTHDNLLIQGDNLEALKALLPFYRGQVKCIFIDPPYNTKSAFEHYDDNLEHAQWLSMMLPRLQLLRELLREDGSIWVTIDDNEGHYLKVLMDEVFQRVNFIGELIWQKRTSRENRAAISSSHDAIYLYAKKPAKEWKQYRNPLPPNEIGLSNPDNDPRGVWKSVPFTAQGFRENQMYEIEAPDGTIHLPPKGRCWGATESEFVKLRDDEKRIYFPKDGKGRPRVKQFPENQSGLVPMTLWFAKEVGDNEDSKKESLALFPDYEAFGTPKPEALLQRVFQIATNPNDLILDSFLGSGTTAAVAQKMGRRWIGIEMGEHAKTHCLPRLQKVIDGEQGGISKAVNWQGGGSFRFMKLGATIFDETGAINPEVRFATLAAFIWMQETGTPWRGFPPLQGEGEGGDGVRVRSNPSKTIPLPTSPLKGEGLKSAGATPFLGTYNGVDYFLLFNGILGDKRPQAGNVLTRAVLQELTLRYPAEARPRVIYGESNRLGEERLKEALVQFKTLPHEVVKK